ncbi:putative glycosyltransferase EpsH [compost metagenome]
MSYAEHDTRVVVIDQENRGASAARNQGMLQAKGAYVGFVDADDWLEPGYIQQLIDAYTVGIDLVCCGYYDHSIYGTYVPVSDYQDSNARIGQPELIQKLIKGTGGVPWGKLFKKSIVDQYNIRFHTKVKMSEDLIFNLEYALHVQKAAVIQHHLYHYNRLNEHSLSARIEESYIESYIIVNEELDVLLSRAGMEQAEKVQYLDGRLVKLLHRICNHIAADKVRSLLQKKHSISELLHHKAFKNLKNQHAAWLLVTQLLRSKMQVLKNKVKKIWK